MYNVSDEQVDFILDDIAKRGIVTEDVKYNILDHVCCIIENGMKSEKDFNKVYENTIAQFYLNDLSEIEDETQKLLTFKHYYAMKRTLKITGITSIILIILGIIFKLQHWPGAGVIIVLGLAFFSLVFIPLNILLKFQDDKESSNRIIMTVGMVAASAATIGVLFKIMFWPYANILMLSSLLVFVLGFIPIYFIIKYKNPETKFTAIINTTFMIGAAGMLIALINLSPSRDMTKMQEDKNSQEVIQTSNNIQNVADYTDLAKRY